MKRQPTCLTWALTPGTLIVLVACGGGGGDPLREEAVLSPSPQALDQPLPQLVAISQTPSYEAGSPHRAAFDAINAARTNCGWVELTRNLKLDQAAQGQADYETARWNEGTGFQFVIMLPHSQLAELSKFTGSTFTERLRAVGYVSGGLSSEVSSGIPTDRLPSSDADRARTLTEGLMTTVYHLRAMVAKGTEFGVGYSVATDAPRSGFNAPTATLVGILGTPYGVTLPAQTKVLMSFPCQGSVALAAWKEGEWPNPIPNDMNWSLPLGPPLYLRSPSGTTLQLASVSVTGYTGEHFLMSHLNDPNFRLQSNDAFVLLRTPLNPGQSYTASFTGTIDGAHFTHQFTFYTK